MNIKIFIATFCAVLLAELADKTQIVSISMSAKTNSPITVFIGSVSAYIIITGLSVFIGSLFGKYINPIYVKYVGGALFILIGILILTSRI